MALSGFTNLCNQLALSYGSSPRGQLKANRRPDQLPIHSQKASLKRIGSINNTALQSLSTFTHEWTAGDFNDHSINSLWLGERAFLDFVDDTCSGN